MRSKIYFLFILSFISAVFSEDATPSPSEEMVDRLAVNLAGAFVKSMFPEMERKASTEAPAAAPPPAPSSDIRRAPINPLTASMEGYSPSFAASEYNAIPQLSQSGDSPRNPFSYQGQQPSPYSLMPETSRSRTSQTSGMDGLGALALSGMSGQDLPGILAGQGQGNPQAINAVRNQAYLAELAKHQSELSAYSAKQMEYLDQQRRYQQAMIDHQAGAALLMQKQQQEVIQEQIKKMKQSYGVGGEVNLEEKPQGNVEFAENDNTVGGRYLTARARGTKTMKVPTNRKLEDDDVIANDEYLKEYFKQNYNIDIPDNVDDLSADEKATLRALKKELSRRKEKTETDGVFKTMDKLKAKMTNERAAPSSNNNSPNEACDQCIPMNIKMMRGAWTQIYGNPKVVNKVFGTIMSLENLKTSGGSTKMSKKRAACVGMEIGKTSHRKSSKMNLFFRDTEEGNELHELRGTVNVRDNIMNIETNLYRTHMCLVKAGPSESDRLEYVVLAETAGKNACQSYHVFVRDTDEFNRRHFDDVSEFMKAQKDVLPVGALPKSSLCELNAP